MFKYKSGTIEDTGDVIHLDEVVGSPDTVQWIEKTSWRRYPIFDQNGSASCVAQTASKILGILHTLKGKSFIKFSASDIYCRRSNYPSGGMIGNDAFNILSNGVTLNDIVNGEKLTERQMNAVSVPPYAREIGELFKIEKAEPIVLPADIEKVASVIQHTKKPVMVWFYFTYREWAIKNGISKDWNMPKLLDIIPSRNGKNVIRHSVTAVDFTLTRTGKRALVCEDSAHFGGYVRRIIDEDFFAERNFYSAYPMSLKYMRVVSGTSKKYNIKIPVSFGMRNDTIKKIQTMLKDTGFFPENVPATGYYGIITCKAVLAWQIANKVDTTTRLKMLGGKYFGYKSIKAVQ